jgi:hypothetical protein
MREYTKSEQALQLSKADPELAGTRVGLIGTLFGCWHGNLSRPFTYGKTSYRVCLKCGARRKFDTKTLKTSGGFYYPNDV